MLLVFALPLNSVTIGEKIVRYDNKRYLITLAAKIDLIKEIVSKPRHRKYVFTSGVVRIGFAYYFVVTMATKFNSLSQVSVKFILIERKFECFE